MPLIPDTYNDVLPDLYHCEILSATIWRCNMYALMVHIRCRSSRSSISASATVLSPVRRPNFAQVCPSMSGVSLSESGENNATGTRLNAGSAAAGRVVRRPMVGEVNLRVLNLEPNLDTYVPIFMGAWLIATWLLMGYCHVCMQTCGPGRARGGTSRAPSRRR